MSLQPPLGAKRNITAVTEGKENVSPEPLLKTRQAKTPKLNSLQLDKLYKDLRKENNSVIKKQIKPNLKTARKHGPAPSAAVL